MSMESGGHYVETVGSLDSMEQRNQIKAKWRYLQGLCHRIQIDRSSNMLGEVWFDIYIYI